ncbi:MAG: hypothetical protein MZV63_27130 [Marinilabiliales bacterium]|nr:hypothetical protein [Marinilabiliales bacterium]
MIGESTGSLYGAVSHHPDNSPITEERDQAFGLQARAVEEKWIDDGVPEN